MDNQELIDDFYIEDEMDWKYNLDHKVIIEGDLDSIIENNNFIWDIVYNGSVSLCTYLSVNGKDISEKDLYSESEKLKKKKNIKYPPFFIPAAISIYLESHPDCRKFEITGMLG